MYGAKAPYIFSLNCRIYHRGDIMNTKNTGDLPLGLGMALMQNTDAFLYFSALGAEKQQQIIEKSKSVKSRKEMKTFVDSLTALG